MTREEYDNRIADIAVRIENDPEYDAQSDINDLKDYKPVSLGVYVIETMYQMKHPDRFKNPLQTLSGRYTFLINCPYFEDAVSITRDYFEEKNNIYGITREDYLYAGVVNDQSYYDEMNELCEKLLEDWNYSDSSSLHRVFHSASEYYGFLTHKTACDKRFSNEKPLPKVQWIRDQINAGYYLNWLENEDDREIVMIESGPNRPVMRFLRIELEYLGKKIIYLSDEDMTEGQSADRLLEIVESAPACDRPVLGPTVMIDNLGIYGDLRKYLERLSGKIPRIQKHLLALARLGDYQTYISGIYCMDAHEAVNRKPSKRFSVIIPARNSAQTLRYTLMSVLDQTYKGDYEVIISDNSTSGNPDVYALCKEQDDPRIRYIKTPRNLHLPKSFEYAYLHAEGEYVTALGSDDGMLPWALEIIDEVVSKYPDEQIIQWERGFYAWPGFNGGQQNQFVIPRAYKRDDYRAYYRDTNDYLAHVLNDPQDMYKLPMLYINSCFRRDYLQTLIERTGRLWDGMCQDIYMGLVTAAIMPKVLNVEMSLTIAGMSSGSVGAKANFGRQTNEEFEKIASQNKADANMGGYARCGLEDLTPSVESDVSTLYTSLLRIINMGLLPYQYVTDVINWKSVFVNLANKMDIKDVAVDRMIHQMRYSASLHGQDFLNWFDEHIYEPAMVPRLMKTPPASEKPVRAYKPGRSAAGGVMLDASEYGVTDVYGATKLFMDQLGYGSDNAV